MRHEQAAVHAAKDMRESTGKVGVVLIRARRNQCSYWLLDALMDSVPVVCLTGQVPNHLIGTDAFQEELPCTKHNYLVKASGDLQRSIEKAFHVARTGRQAVVMLICQKIFKCWMRGGGAWKDKALALSPYSVA